jgi:hypothetical protein
VSDVDGSPSSGADGLRIGASGILMLGPDGTATSVTLYARGRRGQYAVRILGVTGRTRVLRFHAGTGLDDELIERRSEPRCSAEALGMLQAAIRPRCPVDVVDLSSQGIHMQSVRRRFARTACPSAWCGP